MIKSGNYSEVNDPARKAEVKPVKTNERKRRRKRLFASGGQSWSSYWGQLISATVEDAAPTNVVLTFPSAKTALGASDFTIAGFTVDSASWTGAVLTLVLSEPVLIFDEDLIITFVRTGETATVTNNVADDGNTVGWYAVSDLTTITKDGLNRVAEWADKLGSGHDLLQSTDDNKPIYSSSGLLFDGSNDYLRATFTFNHPFVFYAVIKQVTSPLNGYDRIIQGTRSTAMILAQLSPSFNLYINNGSSVSGGVLAQNTYGIVIGLFNGANSLINVNGAVVTGSAGTANADGINLGGNGAASFANVEIKEAIFRKGADDAETQAEIFNYLQKKNVVTADKMNVIEEFGDYYEANLHIFGAPCLGNNGYVYAPAFKANNILKINPVNDSHSTFTDGNIYGAFWKWSSFVNGGNGYIYGVPYTDERILKINTTNDAVSFVAGMPDYNQKWESAVLAGNGFIYMIPSCYGKILKFNPANDTSSEIGNFAQSEVNGQLGFAKWGKSLLAPNGCIYAIPHFYNKILKIDPTDDSITEIGDFGGAFNFGAGVVTSGGIIYCLPYNLNKILKLDTSDNSSSYIDLPELPQGSAAENYGGAVIGVDGRIYGIPFSYSKIMIIDPLDDNVSYIGDFGVGEAKWIGGTLSANGAIYSPPRYIYRRTILKLLAY